MDVSALRKLLRKYHNNTASAAERYVIDNWYQSLDQEADGLGWLEDEQQLSVIKERMTQRAITRPVVVKWHQRTWVRAAAAVLLIVGVGLSWPRKTPVVADSTYYTGNAELKRIRLNDSTDITLNANSTLTVPGDYGSRDRQVQLSGEAYFNVHTDNAHPFIVNASGVSVKVLGTAFNIRSYTHLSDIHIALYTGKVQVTPANAPAMVLLPGQQLTYSKTTGTIAAGDVAKEAPLWLSGTVVLENASFEELRQHFLDLYGMEIRSNSADVLNKQYNITLRSKTGYETAITQLCIMINKKYRKEDNHVIIIY